MVAFTALLERHGTEHELAPGEVLFHQGAESDGIYYLKQGCLGVYREEQDEAYLLSTIQPGGIVGELGSATGWARTATVKAEEPSSVVHLPEAHFRRVVQEAPALAGEIACRIGEWLTGADTARVLLGRSYRQATQRVEELSTEKERLEELLRLREELVGFILHDLRNPLGVLSSAIELLRGMMEEEEVSEDVTAVVSVMGRSLRRMQHLVATLMDIARLEEGELQLQCTWLQVGSLVEDVLEEERAVAEIYGVTLIAPSLPDLPPVLADRDVLQRILINLVDNALKYTPYGGRVWIEAQPGDGVVEMSVVDTGPGIPPAERSRVFEKFTQIAGREGKRQGAGLGLAFCRMAVEAHGGQIWVEEGPEGVGSRFRFTLPSAEQPI
jgi:signal transduction histidine kinase